MSFRIQVDVRLPGKCTAPWAGMHCRGHCFKPSLPRPRSQRVAGVYWSTWLHTTVIWKRCVRSGRMKPMWDSKHCQLLGTFQLLNSLKRIWHWNCWRTVADLIAWSCRSPPKKVLHPSTNIIFLRLQARLRIIIISLLSLPFALPHHASCARNGRMAITLTLDRWERMIHVRHKTQKLRLTPKTIHSDSSNLTLTQIRRWRGGKKSKCPFRLPSEHDTSKTHCMELVGRSFYVILTGGILSQQVNAFICGSFDHQTSS